jgi:hypothetical protein
MLVIIQLFGDGLFPGVLTVRADIHNVDVLQHHLQAVVAARSWHGTRPQTKTGNRFMQVLVMLCKACKQIVLSHEDALCFL